MDYSIDLKVILAIIGIVVSILGIIIGGVFAYSANWGRNKKSLSYQIISNSLIPAITEVTKEKLENHSQGKSFENVRLINLKIINDGKQPITRNDFDQPLYFVFDDDAEILSAEILSVNPENLPVSKTFEKTRLIINPLLLNSRDFIQIQIVVDSIKSEIKCDGRIVGISKIKKVDNPLQIEFSNFLRHTIAVIFTMISFYFTGTFASWLFQDESIRSIIHYIEFTGISLILITLLYEFLREIIKDKPKHKISE